MPGAGRTFPFLEHDGPIAFAHRGGAADGLENSMAAFQRAVDLGYRYLETDVHATADGVLLAFHDNTLDRVTDRSGRVARLPWARSAGPASAGREPIPLLEDLLGSWPDIRVNIDVKERAAVGAAGRGASARTGAVDRVCVASFSEPPAGGRTPGASARGCAPRWPPAASLGSGLAALHPAAHRLAPRGGRLRPGPRPGRPAPGRHARPGRRWPTRGGCGCTSGRSTTPRRCTGCSTSGWTG